MSFYDRKKLSEKRLDDVKRIATEKGFVVGKIGLNQYKQLIVENDIREIIWDDKTRSDPVIHSIRFEADLVFIDITMYKGYKAELNHSEGEDYSIELDSFEGVLNDSKRFAQKRVCFVLTNEQRIDACWVNDIVFYEIRIPKWRAIKHDYDTQKFYKQIKHKYRHMHDCRIHYTNDESDKGSGTPFGLVHQNSNFIKPLEIFLDDIKYTNYYNIQ